MPLRLIQGNEAVFLGALKAGASFYGGYPITPSNEIMATAAKYADTHSEFKFLQCEDELSAAMSVVGASMAGAKAFTATSGPGFSLMQETLGYAYMTNTPTVYVNVQRVGPSTGMPTYPAQGDILQMKHGSHGDYQSIVICPNSVEEAYKYTYTAFDIAEEAEMPVILASDGFLGHLTETVDLDAIELPSPAPRKRPAMGKGKRHFTGLLAKDGVPQTADPAVYREWYEARKRQILSVAESYALDEYIPNKNSDTLIVSYGIVSRLISELAEKYSLWRPIRLFPVLSQELKKAAAEHKRIVVVEANDGQYASEVERVLGRGVEKIPLLGGDIRLGEVKKVLSSK